MIDVITSFNQSGYDLYGKRFLESWLKFWPDTHTITVYTEQVNVPAHQRVTQLDLLIACPGVIEFKQHCSQQAAAQSDTKRKNYFLKAAKWSHKVFAMDHALATSTARYLIWLDADTWTRALIPAKWEQRLLQGACFAAHSELIRHGWHIESGLVIFDLAHKDIDIVKQDLAMPYRTPYRIFQLTKPWDSFWLWQLSTRVAFNDLNRGGVFGHPLVKPYLVHEVGKKKYKAAGINPYTLNFEANDRQHTYRKGD